jgi:Spy/CpxP family protein refolding chaperone
MIGRLLLTAILAVAVASAQRGGGGGGKKGGGGGGGEFNMPRVVQRFEAISEMLKLTKDQKKEFKSTMDEAQKEAAPIRDHMLKSRLEIGDAVQAGKSQDEIAKLTASLGSLQAQMTEIELKTFAKVYKMLEGEQKNASRDLLPQMKTIFMGKNWNNPE